MRVPHAAHQRRQRRACHVPFTGPGTFKFKSHLILMDTHQKLTLRELLLEQLLQESAVIATSLKSQISAFKQSLSTLAPAYSVVIVAPGGSAVQELAGKPLQLLITPREEAASSLRIRVTGILAAVDGPGQGLGFKPSAVDISRDQPASACDALQDEIDSAQHLIAHVHQVLKALRHENTPHALALSA